MGVDLIENCVLSKLPGCLFDAERDTDNQTRQKLSSPKIFMQEAYFTSPHAREIKRISVFFKH